MKKTAKHEPTEAEKRTRDVVNAAQVQIDEERNQRGEQPAPVSPRAALCRISALCRAVENRIAEAEDKAATLAEYLAAIRDTATAYWKAERTAAR